eukprot:gene7099-21093_t
MVIVQKCVARLAPGTPTAAPHTQGANGYAANLRAWLAATPSTLTEARYAPSTVKTHASGNAPDHLASGNAPDHLASGNAPDHRARGN